MIVDQRHAATQIGRQHVVTALNSIDGTMLNADRRRELDVKQPVWPEHPVVAVADIDGVVVIMQCMRHRGVGHESAIFIGQVIEVGSHLLVAVLKTQDKRACAAHLILRVAISRRVCKLVVVKEIEHVDAHNAAFQAVKFLIYT